MSRPDPPAGSERVCRPDLPGLPAGAEPVFAEPWQAQAFAMAVALNEQGAFPWSDWAATLGAALRDEPDYWRAWLAALEAMLARTGIATADAVGAREARWHAAAARTPHGEPIEL